MPLPQPPIDNTPDTDAPKISPLDLFLAFSQLAMSGFGGVLPWAHRTLVERKGWLTQREFVDTLALGQLLPGPNIGNMAVMIGYRFAGYTGAAAAFAGLVAGPFLLMIAAGLAYQTYGALPLVQQALSGMSAVAAGLVLATGLKMSGKQFADAYALAQAAPGPNMMFVTLLGWQLADWAGAVVATLAIVGPPILLTMGVTRLNARNPDTPLGRAIRGGLGPIAIGLTLSSGWILARSSDHNWPAGVLTLLTVALMLRTRLNPVWLILAGAIAGMTGII